MKWSKTNNTNFLGRPCRLVVSLTFPKEMLVLFLRSYEEVLAEGDGDDAPESRIIPCIAGD